MNALRLLGIVTLLVAGCDEPLEGPTPDLAMPQGEGNCGACTSVSGFALDVDALTTSFALQPEITASALLMFAERGSLPVLGRYADGTATEMELSDAQGDFSLMVKQNAKVQLVTVSTAATANTLTQGPVTVGTSAVTNAPAWVFDTTPGGSLDGIATAAGVSVADLMKDGVCIVFTNDTFTPPFWRTASSTIGTVDSPGYDVYAITDVTTTPPTYAKQAMSTVGRYALRKPGLASHESIQIIAAGSIAYPAGVTCDVWPGSVTFLAIDPTS